MNSYWQEHQKKLVSADHAVKVVKSGDWINYGCINGQVTKLDEALAKRKDELSDVKIWTMLSLHKPKVADADPQGDSFTFNSWHFSGGDRRISDQGNQIFYAPMRFAELPRYIKEHIEPINVSMLQAAPMDKHGYFNFGPQNSHCKAACDRASIVIVETNHNQPRCLGGYNEAIHISQVDYIVESDNHPLVQLNSPPPTDIDTQVARHIVAELEDGCCIQLGIGAMVNAVGQMIASSDLKNLGCHTEMLGDAYIDLFESGKLNGSMKSTDPGKMAYCFALGSQRLYDFLDDNPLCAIYPVDYTNRVSVASANDRLVTINNAVEVDLYGQVCAESSGTRHISGTGGQLDFVMAAYESRGGKSFICLPSCYTGKDGRTHSRIVPTLTQGAIVTDPRTIAHYIATEYGVFELKGKTTWQRAEGLIQIAHPDFRDELIAAAQKQNIWRRTNKI